MATRELKAAALAVAAAVSSTTNHNTIACEAVAAVVSAVATDSDLLGRNVPRKPNGRYLRTHLPTPGNSFWRELLAHGDEMAFFNFTALLRGSFTDLVELCKEDLLSMPIRGHTGDITHHSPRRCHQRRRLFTPTDIIAMTMKFLTTTAELKDLHPQFGALKTTYDDCVWLGMQVIVKNLINDERAKVFWPINEPGYLERCAERTAMFDQVPNVVGMADGLRRQSKNPRDPLKQNRDFSGYGHDCYRNNVFVWDTYGKIVDCSLNAPGNFHDSKNAFYGRIYRHIACLPDPYCIVADSAFYTRGRLSGKIIKTQQEQDPEDKSEKASQTTHIRQPSEWGNNSLTGTFRRLQVELPTSNLKRAYVLWSCVLLLNWRTETCDRSQIRTYFDYLKNEADAEKDGSSSS